MSSYQVGQDVVVALCILALFDNLEDKVRGERENKTPVIHKPKAPTCACFFFSFVCVHN